MWRNYKSLFIFLLCIAISFIFTNNIYATYWDKLLQIWNIRWTNLLDWESANLNFPKWVATDIYWNIYIADSSNNQVKKYDLYWKRTAIWSLFDWWSIYWTNNTWLSNPWWIFIDFQWNIYITDYNNYRIKKYDSSWNLLMILGDWIYWDNNLSWTGAEFKWLRWVATDNLLNIYTLDAWAKKVKKYDMYWNYLFTIWNWTTGDWIGNLTLSSFNSPYWLTVDSDGNIYVADTWNNKVKKYDTNWNYLFTIWWGWVWLNQYWDNELSNENSLLANPTAVVIDNQWFIYVGDLWNNKVKKYYNNWKLKQIICNDYTKNIYWMWIDINWNIYTVDMNNSKVYKLDWNVKVSIEAFETISPLTVSTIQWEKVSNTNMVSFTTDATNFYYIDRIDWRLYKWLRSNIATSIWTPLTTTQVNTFVIDWTDIYYSNKNDWNSIYKIWKNSTWTWIKISGNNSSAFNLTMDNTDIFYPNSAGSLLWYVANAPVRVSKWANWSNAWTKMNNTQVYTNILVDWTYIYYINLADKKIYKLAKNTSNWVSAWTAISNITADNIFMDSDWVNIYYHTNSTYGWLQWWLFKVSVSNDWATPWTRIAWTHDLGSWFIGLTDNTYIYYVEYYTWRIYKINKNTLVNPVKLNDVISSNIGWCSNAFIWLVDWYIYYNNGNDWCDLYRIKDTNPNWLFFWNNFFESWKLPFTKKIDTISVNIGATIPEWTSYSFEVWTLTTTDIFWYGTPWFNFADNWRDFLITNTTTWNNVKWKLKEWNIINIRSPYWNDNFVMKDITDNGTSWIIHLNKSNSSIYGWSYSLSIYWNNFVQLNSSDLNWKKILSMSELFPWYVSWTWLYYRIKMYWDITWLTAPTIKSVSIITNLRSVNGNIIYKEMLAKTISTSNFDLDEDYTNDTSWIIPWYKVLGTKTTINDNGIKGYLIKLFNDSWKKWFNVSQ